jgi:hypothetical protein
LEFEREAIYFTPDNQRLVTTGYLSPMKRYSSDGTFQKAFNSFYTEGGTFSPKEQGMVSIPHAGNAVILDTLGQIVKTLAFDEKPESVQFSSDGKHFFMLGGIADWLMKYPDMRFKTIEKEEYSIQ